MANLPPHASSLNTVDSFLNEKIRTAADLENLDDIFQSLQYQQDLQRRQLREAEEILKQATKASDEHAATVYKKTEAFNKEQEDIDIRLMLVTQSENNDEAVQRFEESMQKLRRLDVAKGYMELLNTAENLSQEVSMTLQSAPPLALSPYTQLRNLYNALKAAQPSADGAAPHLVDHVGQASDNLRTLIATEYTSRFEAVLERIKWPAQDLDFSGSSVREWSHWCGLLLDLQEPELVADTPGLNEKFRQSETPVLLPLEVMARPLELRFRYHFSGDKATNRLDKPEYFLSHIIDLVNTHSDFFVGYLQPMLNEWLRDSPSRPLKFYSDAVSSYITSLLPMVRQKLRNILPQISDQPQLLSHFMHELMTFDNELRETWDYTPRYGSEETWKGLTWEVLVSQDWFNKWLQVEKDFALSRYHNIIENPDSGEIDYDGVEPGATKPTKAAIRVNDLLETITERYQPLSSFSQKIRFLVDIQIAIFDLFHERLHSGLEAYLAMTSTIARTVQSGNQPSLEGVAGLERLCRIFGSAEYLEKKMQDWSDDVFFLELWSGLQNRAEQNTRTGRPVAGSMSVSDVAARTSQSVARNDNESSGDKADGALFDETASAYRRLRVRSESLVVSALASSIQSALRPYSRVSTWAFVSASAEESVSGPSFDMANVVRIASTELSFLFRVVAKAPLRRITRQFLLAVQSYIWDNVLMRHSFSATGAAQLALDINTLCRAIDAAIGIPEGEGGSQRAMQKLVEGVSLLELQGKSQNTENMATGALDLWEAEKRFFESNESARNALAQLGLETLTETEARAILERRVELRE